VLNTPPVDCGHSSAESDVPPYWSNVALVVSPLVTACSPQAPRRDDGIRYPGNVSKYAWTTVS
jgi:hypothetical protein